MRRKAGKYMAGMGTVILTTMGCCLDSAAWRVVLAFVMISFVMIAVGVKMMDIPEALEEKGFRFESKAVKDRKAENRKETFATWKATW